MTPTGKIKLGVAGIGNMGSEHCRMLAAGKCSEIELVAVADLREERLEWARKNLPEQTKVYHSGSKMIRENDCDAILVCTPHFGHEALTIEALEAGKHVLCEKPAAVTASAARCMKETAERCGKRLTYMLNQRTNCIYRGIHELMSSGMLGKMKRMNWIVTDWYRTQRYYDSGTWRATWAGEGGGVLLNQCPHQLDLLIWLCGMPACVQAVTHEGKWHKIEVEDDVSAYLEFPGGATGLFVASTGDLPGTNRLEIDCEQGKIVCEDGTIKYWKLEENEREVCFKSDNPWYKPEVSPQVFYTDGKNPQHAGVLNAFAAHLLRGEKMTATAEDGLRAIMLSNAIHLAGWTGERIQIPADETVFETKLKEKIAGSKMKTGGDMTYDTDHMKTGAKR